MSGAGSSAVTGSNAGAVDDQFGEAYTLHRDPLHRWLTARTRDPELAEELVQEAFIRLMRTMRSGVQVENPRAWLFHAAGNLMVSHVRHVRVAGRFVPESPAYEAASAESVVLAQERMEHLERVLGRLTPDDRQLLLSTGLGLNGPRLADQAGISQVALRARLCRARKRLREQVELDAGSCLGASAAFACGRRVVEGHGCRLAPISRHPAREPPRGSPGGRPRPGPPEPGPWGPSHQPALPRLASSTAWATVICSISETFALSFAPWMFAIASSTPQRMNSAPGDALARVSSSGIDPPEPIEPAGFP
jgi:RNA polymerase sigma-70 factor (ECF subfamily)